MQALSLPNDSRSVITVRIEWPRFRSLFASLGGNPVRLLRVRGLIGVHVDEIAISDHACQITPGKVGFATSEKNCDLLCGQGFPLAKLENNRTGLFEGCTLAEGFDGVGQPLR